MSARQSPGSRALQLQAVIADFEQAEMPTMRADLDAPSLTLSLVENGVIVQVRPDLSPAGVLVLKEGTLLFEPPISSPPRIVEELKPSDLSSWIREALTRT